MKSEHGACPQHEGCDVRLQPSRGGDCDVRLEPTAQDLIEVLEESDDDMPLDDWAKLLRQVAPKVYAEPPPPKDAPCLAEPGTEAKIQTMAERVARGESPFAPEDLVTDSNERAGREVHRLRNGRDEQGRLRELRRDKAEVDALVEEMDSGRKGAA
jgi:hypothetical protein